LQTGIGVGKDLQIDAGRVHVGDTALADIVEALGQPRRLVGVDARVVPLDLGIEIMLFERNDVGFVRHFRSSPRHAVGLASF
jgi:hypothetical protein